MPSPQQSQKNPWRTVKSEEWDATFPIWNEFSPQMAAYICSNAGRICDLDAACQTLTEPTFCACGATYLQSRHRTHHLPLMLNLSSTGRSRTIFTSDLFRCN